MNHIQLHVSSATARCKRFIQFLMFNSKVQGFTAQIISYTHLLISMVRHAINARVIHMLDTSGTLRARAHQGLRASRLRLTRSVALAIGISLSIPMAVADGGSIEAIKPKDFIRMSLDHREASCLIKLYGKESGFNPYAIGNLNGKYHTYGIPQIKNALIYDKTPIQQVQYGLKYIDHRYHGDTCMAWTHWLRVGWH